MTISCPRCNSTHIKLRNIARRTEGTIGAVAGATSGSIGLTLGKFVDDSSHSLTENIYDHEDDELDQL